MTDQYNYYSTSIEPEQSMPVSEVKKILEKDKTFVEKQSQQMLTLINIIDAFTSENNELKKKNNVLQNSLKACDAGRQQLNNTCIDQKTYNTQSSEITNYLNFQNIILIILLILLIILIFYRCIV